MIAGVEIELGGEKFIVPPLNFRAVRELIDDIASLKPGAPFSADQLDKSTGIVLAAIRRNYPDMTQARLEELLDMANIRSILPAILGASGLKPAGEATAAGANRSTGTGSMPA